MKKRLTALLVIVSILVAIGTMPAVAAESVAENLTQQKTAKLKTEVFTTSSDMGRWASVSAITQFVDHKRNNIGFAYDDSDNVYIVKVRDDLKAITTLTIKKKFPKLGTVTCDEDGNYYIVWGQNDAEGEGGVKTIAVSKYSNKGKFIKTASIKSKNDGGLGDSDTKEPFAYGNCDVTIYNGVLVCSYGRLMYNGHQSNAIIAVNIDDMKLNKDYSAYTSHSFDQRVINYTKGDCVIFADHGDAYYRGFCINAQGKNIDKLFIPFSFYEEPEYWSDMYLLNYTNAQLGGIGEVSTGLALVAASAKSYSPDFWEEKKQLFIQIFDPTIQIFDPNDYTSPAKYVLKGSTRNDADDNVIDENVKWLTNYTKGGVENPQMVVTDDDRIVIMWEYHRNTKNEYGYEQYSFRESKYMVLSSKGKILQKATSMGSVRLNCCEEPYYINDSVYWVTIENYGDKKAIINRLKI